MTGIFKTSIKKTKSKTILDDLGQMLIVIVLVIIV